VSPAHRVGHLLSLHIAPDDSAQAGVGVVDADLVTVAGRDEGLAIPGGDR
jgi:hypothetical protein